MPSISKIVSDIKNVATKLKDTHDKAVSALGTKLVTNIETIWSGTEAPYVQTISVPGVTSNSSILISPTSSATQAQVEAYQKLNWTDGGQANNSITLKAWGTKNSVTIPINVTILG